MTPIANWFILTGESCAFWSPPSPGIESGSEDKIVLGVYGGGGVVLSSKLVKKAEGPNASIFLYLVTLLIKIIDDDWTIKNILEWKC